MSVHLQTFYDLHKHTFILRNSRLSVTLNVSILSYHSPSIKKCPFLRQFLCVESSFIMRMLVRCWVTFLLGLVGCLVPDIAKLKHGVLLPLFFFNFIIALTNSEDQHAETNCRNNLIKTRNNNNDIYIWFQLGSRNVICFIYSCSFYIN